MRTIAVEEHFLPADLVTQAGIDPVSLRGRLDQLSEAGEQRLAVMDEAGVDIQILSVPVAASGRLDDTEATEISRALNDRMAALVSTRADRFAAFASLPMRAPHAAAAELTRCVTELGLVGALVAGPIDGVFLDEPVMAPVLQAAEDLGVPIYLHPAPPPAAVRDAYFSGLEPAVAASLSTSAWHWHAEAGMHVLRMAASGTFQRHPGLQLIVGHMGENLPFSLARADERLSPVLGLSVSEILREHLWITTCGYETTPPLLCALAVFGADRMMFSIDYPYGESTRATTFLTDAPLSPGDRELIAHGNAERLLGL
jgi:uncharacterized protein